MENRRQKIHFQEPQHYAQSQRQEALVTCLPLNPKMLSNSVSIVPPSFTRTCSIDLGYSSPVLTLHIGHMWSRNFSAWYLKQERTINNWMWNLPENPGVWVDHHDYWIDFLYDLPRGRQGKGVFCELKGDWPTYFVMRRKGYNKLYSHSQIFAAFSHACQCRTALSMVV